MENQPAVLYESPLYPDPCFPVVFHNDRMDEMRRAVYANWHAGVEVLYCYKGQGQLLHGSATAVFKRGDVVVINSNTLHTLRLQSDACQYYCIIVDPRFLLENGIDAGGARFLPVVRDERVLACCRDITRVLVRKQPYYKPEALSLILQLFVELMRHHTEPSAHRMPQSEKGAEQIVMQALAYIRKHLQEPIRLDDISTHIGISKYYFCKLFSRYTGMTVLQHINMHKCEVARKRLHEEGMTVSEAARLMGFQNLSYFTRVYKKHLGIAPSQEKRKREGWPEGE